MSMNIFRVLDTFYYIDFLNMFQFIMPSSIFKSNSFTVSLPGLNIKFNFCVCVCVYMLACICTHCVCMLTNVVKVNDDVRVFLLRQKKASDRLTCRKN